MTMLARLGRAVPLFAVAFAALGFAAPVASAQSIGARVGMNFDSNNALLGGQLVLPLSGPTEFYPSVDIFFPDAGSLLGLNADLKYNLPTGPGPGFYLGGGLGILRSSYRSAHHNSVGANLLFGVDSKKGAVRPFAEGRVLLNDNTSFQLVGGLNFSLGTR